MFISSHLPRVKLKMEITDLTLWVARVWHRSVPECWCRKARLRLHLLVFRDILCINWFSVHLTWPGIGALPFFLSLLVCAASPVWSLFPAYQCVSGSSRVLQTKEQLSSSCKRHNFVWVRKVCCHRVQQGYLPRPYKNLSLTKLSFLPSGSSRCSRPFYQNK